jgi:hypothetical protein
LSLVNEEKHLFRTREEPGRERCLSSAFALTRVLSTGLLDFVQIWEDMAYKTAPMISAQFVRDYMLPAYEELVAYLRKGGVKLITVPDIQLQESCQSSSFLEVGSKRANLNSKILPFGWPLR